MPSVTPNGLSITYRQTPSSPRRATSVAVPRTSTRLPSAALPEIDAVDDEQGDVISDIDNTARPQLDRQPQGDEDIDFGAMEIYL